MKTVSILLDRAREYLKDKYLDLADVEPFIKWFVRNSDRLARYECLDCGGPPEGMCDCVE